MNNTLKQARAFLAIGKVFAIGAGASLAAWLLNLEKSVFLVCSLGGSLLSLLNVAGAAWGARFPKSQMLSKIGSLPWYAAAMFSGTMGGWVTFGFEGYDIPLDQRLGLSLIPSALALLFWIRAGSKWEYGEDKSNPYFNHKKP